jgi:hypothetical protein
MQPEPSSPLEIVVGIIIAIPIFGWFRRVLTQ